MLTPEKIIRSLGFPTKARILTTKLSPISKWEMPQDVVIHYLPQDPTEYGMNINSPIMFEHDRIVLSNHIVELEQKNGKPVELAENPERLVGYYHKRFRKVRRVKKLDTVLSDKKAIIIQDYAILSHLYRYPRIWSSDWNEWSNQRSTVWHHVNAISSEDSSKNQVMLLTMPEVLPEYEDFVKMSRWMDKKDVPSKELLEIFKDEDTLSLWELFDFLTNEDSKAPLTKVDKKALVNLFWWIEESGRWSMVSTMDLQEWFEDKNDGKKLYDVFENILSQRKVSKLSLDEVEAEEIVEAKSEKPKTEEEKLEIKLTESLDGKVGELAASGLLTSGEVKRFEKLSRRFKTIPNPSGDGTLADLASRPTKEQTSLKETTFKDNKGVAEKSQLKSSLNDYDSKYIEEVQDKDRAAMVLSFQRAGLPLTNYKMDEYQDAGNAFRTYSFQFTPIDGETSTIRVQEPIVRPDGNYMMNGVRYRMNKQRGDQDL